MKLNLDVVCHIHEYDWRINMVYWMWGWSTRIPCLYQYKTSIQNNRKVFVCINLQAVSVWVCVFLAFTHTILGFLRMWWNISHVLAENSIITWGKRNSGKWTGFVWNDCWRKYDWIEVLCKFSNFTVVSVIIICRLHMNIIYGNMRKTNIECKENKYWMEGDIILVNWHSLNEYFPIFELHFFSIFNKRARFLLLSKNCLCCLFHFSNFLEFIDDNVFALPMYWFKLLPLQTKSI